MSIDLTISDGISGTPQPVTDQEGGQSGLLLATQQTQVVGQDVVGQSLPMWIVGNPATGQDTHDRLLRLQGANGQFFDVGIDGNGTLFVNNGIDDPNDPNVRVLSISQDGTVTIHKKLVLPNLTTSPGGTDDVTADSNGNLYRQ